MDSYNCEKTEKSMTRYEYFTQSPEKLAELIYETLDLEKSEAVLQIIGGKMMLLRDIANFLKQPIKNDDMKYFRVTK